MWLDVANKKVVLRGQLCLREGLLEMLVCKQQTKEHESIIAIDAVAKSPTDGYTLVELMAVVAIIGVLAALAVPQYKNYTMQAKAAEAVSVLAHIKTRQESYRSEWDEYCNASVNAQNWNPTATP